MDKKIITYSLLAHINDKSSEQSNFDQIFIPLVKRGLAKMCTSGRVKGNDIEDIKKPLEELYGLNMPDSFLMAVLRKIEQELNTPEKKVIAFYAGGSFIINEFLFEEYEEEFEKKSRELKHLERVFSEFAKAEGKEVASGTLYEFIEANKVSIGKYIGKKYPVEYRNNTLEAKFVNFIQRTQGLYQTLQSVYVGSIISTYLEYEPQPSKHNVELVLDTNFIISLLDLNTPSSTVNCRRLLEISKRLGYVFSVLDITIDETEKLLKVKIDYFETTFLARLVDPEDIYNACERRGLSKTDLERIRLNLIKELSSFGIQHVSNIEKNINRAKFSDVYQRLKEVRNTDFAALHDATCIDYVREKRGRNISDFTKVNCWFINNSSSRGRNYINGNQPYHIKAEELLNMLWLSSPAVKNVLSVREMASIGLSRLVSTALDDSLPMHLPSGNWIRTSKNIHKKGISQMTIFYWYLRV